MKLFYWLLLCVSIASLRAKGQTAWPPPYEIKADTSDDVSLDDKYWQMLEDPSGKLTFNQVSSNAYANKFHVNKTHTNGYNYQVISYWIRYSFKNTLSHPVKIVMPQGEAFGYLYTKDANGKWTMQTSGALVPWSKRDGLKRIQGLIVTVEPGEIKQVYEHDVFDFHFYKQKEFSIYFGYADAVIKSQYTDNDRTYNNGIIFSLLLGILLLGGFINLLFYRIVAEKVYLYFALFILSLGIFDFISNTNNILFREHGLYFYVYLTPILLAVTYFFMMHFVRHFLSTHIITPKWDKFLFILNIAQLLSWVVLIAMPTTVSFKSYTIVTIMGNSIQYVYMLCLLATLLIYLPKTKGPTRVGIYAALPGFALWSFGYLYLYITYTLHDLYKVPYAASRIWLQSWISELELFTFLWMIIVFSWILFKRYQDLQQSFIQSSLDKERLAKEKEIERNQLIEQQKVVLEQEVEARTQDLKRSVEELKTTQQQLIQSEKLASLGELTAGIAHEIQNPLNFVNNFSDVSMELAIEMKEELKAGNADEAAAIADDIEQNLQKIIHHGKRADAIVKNMLQHSRNNSAEKQLTDVNALADEYLRLSYHGLRAKDKTFNSDLSTELDPAVPKINIIPQDIGRVLLNLFNNAFYAVQQRQKADGSTYKPEVKVSTALINKAVQIKVRDNGTGIPEAVKDKILQPFFTTKPTGEGTGLGLSLSYDIVVKGHGGKMEIFSEEGVYTEFVISLPAQ